MFRFNPMRPDLKYHKAVANAIISCLPIRGYFERKLSSQVHEVLMKEKIDLGEVNIIAKCKKRTSSGSSHRRRLALVFLSSVVLGIIGFFQIRFAIVFSSVLGRSLLREWRFRKVRERKL